MLPHDHLLSGMPPPKEIDSSRRGNKDRYRPARQQLMTTSRPIQSTELGMDRLVIRHSSRVGWAESEAPNDFSSGIAGHLAPRRPDHIPRGKVSCRRDRRGEGQQYSGRRSRDGESNIVNPVVTNLTARHALIPHRAEPLAFGSAAAA